MSAIEITAADRAQRAELLAYLIDSLDRPCTPGDGPDERNDELDRIIAQHRIQARNAALDEAAIAVEECGDSSWPCFIRNLKGKGITNDKTLSTQDTPDMRATNKGLADRIHTHGEGESK